MTILKRFLPLFLILVLSFFAFKPLLNPGFFPIHDNTQVARVFEMTKSLHAGMFPVRWVSDLGYGFGYPIFNFYAPLSYYAGSVFNIVGFDALIATKIMMLLGIILAGVFMYLFVSELFGKTSGVVASLFYVYAPYHALDIYVRGDVAEFFAYAFIPLVFYGLWKVYKKRSWIFVSVSALGYAGIILSHNLTAMMISPFIALYILLLAISLYKKKNNASISYLFISIFLGIVISCFYWLPALLEMSNTNVMSIIGGGSHYADHYACISQLWTSNWGYAGSTKGCVDGFSLMIGKLHIIVSLLSFLGLIILVFLKKQKINNEKTIIIGASFLAFVFSLFLTIEASGFIWNNIPLMEFLQFPWRFLLVASFFASVLAGSFIWIIGLFPFKKIFPHFTVEISALLVILLLFLNIKFFTVQKIINVSANYYTNEYSLKWTTSKISDEYLPKNIIKPKNAEEALLNSQKLSFKETDIERISDFVSLAGISLLFLGIIYFKRKYE